LRVSRSGRIVSRMGNRSRIDEADEALVAGVAEAIQAELRKNDRSILWLAGKIDTPPSTLHAQLTSRPEKLSYRTVVRIAAALEVDVSAFIPEGVLR